MLDILDPYNYPFWILIISIFSLVTYVIGRPFSTYVKFVYPNAKFEAIGNPFIGEQELDSIIDNKDVISFKETINTLKDYNVQGEDIYSIQKSLDNTFIEVIEMMKQDSSKNLNEFFNTYLEKFDIYLIKNELKKIYTDRKSEIDIEKAILPKTKEFLVKIKEADKNDLPKILESFGFNKNLISILTDENVDLLTYDITLDKYILSRLSQVKVPYKCEEAKKGYINVLIDTINIKNILRAKQLGFDIDFCKNLFIGEGTEIAKWKFEELSEVEQVSQVVSALEGTSYFEYLKDSIEEYNKEKSVQVFETALDRNLLKLVKDISVKNYTTLGPTIRFLISKEFEIKNLKIIVKGIYEKISSDVIKKLLVWEVGA